MVQTDVRLYEPLDAGTAEQGCCSVAPWHPPWQQCAVQL